MARKRASSGLDGLVLVDKPAGWTSHDVVAKARRLFGQPRIGHTGTLDPFATGLLVLCLGQATRLAEYLTAHEKEYTGEVVLGIETDTADSDGEVTRRAPVPDLGPADLERLAAAFTGRLAQVPPAHSAVKVGGQRAYALARKGEAVELAPREVEVFSLELAMAGRDRLTLRVRCGPGTYVRALARDIGRAIGCGAHLAALRRTRSGPFRVGEAYTLEALERLAAAGRAGDAVLPADEGMLRWSAAILGAAGAGAFARGNPHRGGGFRAPAALARVYDAAGSFLGVGSVDGAGMVRPVKVLRGESREI